VTAFDACLGESVPSSPVFRIDSVQVKEVARRATDDLTIDSSFLIRFRHLTSWFSVIQHGKSHKKAATMGNNRSQCTAMLRLGFCIALLPWVCSLSVPKTYRYFAMGSNMKPATMTALRGIQPLNATAAVLSDYQLAFDIAGSPLLEPSAASVRFAPGEFVHGVLYELTESDFARVGSTEGIPFVYRWEPCRVVPYQGNDETAGQDAVAGANATTTSAFTLTASNPNTPKFIPTSPSYLRILREGAAYWKMDRTYQIQLSKVTTAKNLLVADGLSGSLLEAAERSVKTRKCISQRLVELAEQIDPSAV